jgi:iron complex outermembrane receptor protein
MCLCIVPALADAQDTGRIEGRVTRQSGDGVRGVTVAIDGTSMSTLTDNTGSFVFGNVPAGTYALTFNLGTDVRTRTGITVAAGAMVRSDETVDWSEGFTESLVVRAASRRLERVVEAPGSVTTVEEEQFQAKASPGQLPKLLEFTPGAEVTQSGIYDYNLNTRGFNSSLNRRVATRIDGRDPSISFLGAQEWSAISFPLDDLASLEFVRGPSAALYGPNASSGVLDITTKEPRYHQGGLVRVTAGQLETMNADFRWAGELGGGWYAKTVGGARTSGDFAVSRNGAAEYTIPCPPRTSGECLPQESVPLARLNDNRVLFGAVRVDKYLGDGLVLTGEGGVSDMAGPVFQTGIGRVQFVEVRRPWARVAFSSDRYSLLASYTGRRAPRQLALGPGTNLALKTHRIQVEGQTHWTAADNRVRIVVGGSAIWDDIDSFDKTRNQQTLLREPVTGNEQAVFGQLDWKVTDKLKLVLAGRGDWGALYDFEYSPKGSIVYSVTPNHSLRLTYNEAFQVPNYAEFFLQTDAAPPADLSGLNAVCQPFGVNCGFGLTRVLAVGNRDLDLERIKTWEVGYKGLVAGRGLVTVDYYRAKASNFVTDLLPQLGTALGRINTNFGPWQAPPGLPAAAANTIRSLAPATLSNSADGSTIIAAASYSNFGAVTTEGVDVGVTSYLGPNWRSSFSYSWFAFEIQDELPGFASLLLPNSPEHKASGRLAYERPRLRAAVDARWVDTFRWGVGSFVGTVNSYTVVDMSAQYDLSTSMVAELNVSNLLDDRHWEAFGGDILRRRLLAGLLFRW